LAADGGGGGSGAEVVVETRYHSCAAMVLREGDRGVMKGMGLVVLAFVVGGLVVVVVVVVVVVAGHIVGKEMGKRL